MAKVESTRIGLKFAMDEAANSRTDPSYNRTDPSYNTVLYVYLYNDQLTT